MVSDFKSKLDKNLNPILQYTLSNVGYLKYKNQTTEINTNNWKSGSYPWHIIHNGKVVDEGVWVKQ
jgi:hypothetical protein